MGLPNFRVWPGGKSADLDAAPQILHATPANPNALAEPLAIQFATTGRDLAGSEGINRVYGITQGVTYGSDSVQNFR